MKVHEFSNTRDAYDHCQTGVYWGPDGAFVSHVSAGDIIHIPSLGIVGVVDVWPVAVTAEAGYDLASLTDGPASFLASRYCGVSGRKLREAVEFARRAGYPLAPWATAFADVFAMPDTPPA